VSEWGATVPLRIVDLAASERVGTQYEHGVQGVPSSNLGAPTNLKSQSTEALYPRCTHSCLEHWHL
jgi:hypothetical protein